MSKKMRHRILCDFEVQTDLLIQARPELVIINKKNEFVNLWILLFQWIIEWKWMKAKDRQLLESCKRAEKTLEYGGKANYNCYS